MNGSGQRTIPNVVFPFRSMISKSFSVADNGSEYQVRETSHLIFSIAGSPPESPSANPPGAGTPRPVGYFPS